MRKISLIDQEVERLKQKGAIVQVRSNRTSAFLNLFPCSQKESGKMRQQ